MFDQKIGVDTSLKKQLDDMMQSTGLSYNDLVKRLIHGTELIRSLFGGNSGVLPLSKEYVEALAIGDALCDGIFLVDRSGTIIAINNAFTKMTGMAEDEVTGKSDTVLVKKGLIPGPITQQALKEKKTVSVVSFFKERKAICSATPIFNDRGEVVHVHVVIRDLTELIKLQEQLEYSEKLAKQYIDELNYLRSRERDESGLLGNSPAIRQIRSVMYHVAQVDTTILIMGETGVGKEIVANEIHENSLRKNHPYIKVNCAAIPETLLESELFGYERGAFTGAGNKDKLGLFELANMGTILLDEIGEMPLKLQSKLLRVVQDKEIIRLGSTRPIKLDVRVIAATNQQLEERVASGRFRKDLYYRLNVVPIIVPPLRSRLGDVPILANHFLSRFNEKYNKNKHINISVLEILQHCSWPGNVRELENVIEQLVVMVREPEIMPDHLLSIIDAKKLSPSFVNRSNITLREAVDVVEKQMIQKALKMYGSTHKAARALGVSQPTVLRKAKRLGIRPE